MRYTRDEVIVIEDKDNEYKEMQISFYHVDKTNNEAENRLLAPLISWEPQREWKWAAQSTQQGFKRLSRVHTETIVGWAELYKAE